MKRITAVLSVLLLTLGLALTVRAAGLPDLSRTGSVTLTMEYDGTPLHGGSLSICRVGEIREAEGSIRFALLPELRYADFFPEDLGGGDLAKELAVLAEEKNLPTESAPIREGRAEFSQLEPGLWLVTQSETAAGFAPISPFLLCVPQLDNGRWEYHAAASPKVSPERLPQTGLRNWPVPALALGGLILLSAGWLLYSGGRKRRR